MTSRNISVLIGTIYIMAWRVLSLLFGLQKYRVASSIILYHHFLFAVSLLLCYHFLFVVLLFVSFLFAVLFLCRHLLFAVLLFLCHHKKAEPFVIISAFVRFSRTIHYMVKIWWNLNWRKTFLWTITFRTYIKVTILSKFSSKLLQKTRLYLNTLCMQICAE
jgi:hypothetical protein